MHRVPLRSNKKSVVYNFPNVVKSKRNTHVIHFSIGASPEKLFAAVKLLCEPSAEARVDEKHEMADEYACNNRTSETHDSQHESKNPSVAREPEAEICGSLTKVDKGVVGGGTASNHARPTKNENVSMTESDTLDANEITMANVRLKGTSSVMLQNDQRGSKTDHGDLIRDAKISTKNGVDVNEWLRPNVEEIPESSLSNVDGTMMLRTDSLEHTKIEVEEERAANESGDNIASGATPNSATSFETAKREVSLSEEEDAVMDVDDIIIVSEKRVSTKRKVDVVDYESDRDGVLAYPRNDFKNDEKLNKLRAKVTEHRDLVRDLHRMLSEAATTLNALEQQMVDRVTELRRATDAAFDWNGNSFPWDSILAKELKEKFHIQSFRPLQREALNATLLRRDVYAILPTGAGKSLLYQLAAVVDRGLTLVVTPLISLSVDQRRALRELCIYAECLDSMSSKSIVKHIFNDILPRNGVFRHSSQPRQKRRKVEKERGARPKDSWTRDDIGTTILFVTPEQLVRNKKLMSRVELMYEAGHLSRVVIDEAHCCSSWGHDFRADYRKLGILKRQCPETPILALSATSCPETTSDVCKILEISDCVIFRGSIDRPNLFYEVRLKPNDEEKVIVSIASMLLDEFKNQCGIVYVLSRKEAEIYSDGFHKHGIRCGCYHGEMTREERAKVHEGWQDGRIQVVVATLAFGLGIDNQRTRFVVHATMATSLEGYYQESGRAGRNGKPAKCVVLHRARDFARLSAFVAEKGDARLRKMYQMYRYATGRGLEENGQSEAYCRRALIAAAFGETPPKRTEEERRLCCDICAGQNGSGRNGAVMTNVTELARSALRIMVRQDEKEKMTIRMLATSWGNKGLKGRKVRGDEPAIDRRISVEARIEIIIGLVFVGALQEYHRHSSYAVNAYIMTGSNVERVLEGKTQVRVMLMDEDAKIVGELGG